MEKSQDISDKKPKENPAKEKIRKRVLNKEAETKLSKDPREYITFLMASFKIDRYFYFIATIASLGLLFYTAIVFVNIGNVKAVLSLLAPTGAIASSCYAILRFWNDCFKLIKDYLNKA
jgi:hypothetical protein